MRGSILAAFRCFFFFLRCSVAAFDGLPGPGFRDDMGTRPVLEHATYNTSKDIPRKKGGVKKRPQTQQRTGQTH
jgi:hypothetical protein